MQQLSDLLLSCNIRQSFHAGNFFNICLHQATHREEDPLQLFLIKGGQEICLVLVLVHSLAQLDASYEYQAGKKHQLETGSHIQLHDIMQCGKVYSIHYCIL